MAAAASASYGLKADLLRATELRLGLPGTETETETETQTEEEHKAPPPATPSATPSRGKKRDGVSSGPDAEDDAAAAPPPAAKAQVVGWPPVRSYRKACFQQQQQQARAAKSKPPAKEDAPAPAPAPAGMLVKVSMDGAPYLRKVDLRMYRGYRDLREALEAMFLCFSGAAAADDDAPAAVVNPSDFAVTYEDKDGDLMLVGDVPFDMFVSTCKRLRIMKGCEARSGLDRITSQSRTTD